MCYEIKLLILLILVRLICNILHTVIVYRNDLNNASLINLIKHMQFQKLFNHLSVSCNYTVISELLPSHNHFLVINVSKRNIFHILGIPRD